MLYFTLFALALFDAFPFFGYLTNGLPLLATTVAVVAQPTTSIPCVCGAILTGAVGGDLLGYAAGYRHVRFGKPLPDRFIKKFQKSVDQTALLFQKYGIFIAFVGHWFWFARPAVPYLLGSAKCNFVGFFVFDLAGTAAWVVFWVTFATCGAAAL